MIELNTNQYGILPSTTNSSYLTGMATYKDYHKTSISRALYKLLIQWA
jgi:hypothetical protein